jgi:hypothetical protein
MRPDKVEVLKGTHDDHCHHATTAAFGELAIQLTFVGVSIWPNPVRC